MTNGNGKFPKHLKTLRENKYGLTVILVATCLFCLAIGFGFTIGQDLAYRLMFSLLGPLPQ